MSKILKPSEMLSHIHDRCRDDGGCWVWLGCLQACGTTPTMRIPGTRTTASVRRVVMQAKGIDVTGKLVSNTCESPMCVAPAHLLAMTRKQLQEKTAASIPPDAKIKRNARLAIQSRRRNAKLDDSAVQSIRSADKSVSNSTLAKQHGVSTAAIWRARSYISWKPLEANPFAGLLKT